MNFDFTLKNCCERNQNITFITISACVLINTLFWKCKILEPFKLLTVFLHEFSHASACWLTGGKVKGIEVNRDHGGCTNTVGGNKFVILPAGYIGSCFYGMFFILMAYIHKWTLLASAGLLCFLLLIVLIFYANNFFLRFLCVLFLGTTIFIWFLCVHFKEQVKDWPLKIIMTFIGVLNEMYSMVDIFEDLITRSTPESDAYKYAELTKCNSKFCGVLWFLVNFLFILLTVYLIAAIQVNEFDK
ncbi:peptidase, putative [Plasmodium malariae]|uniref:Peptidase, putative n=2 Tax=Plasmodium malariae TaxID=5858 RepID=A0A1C3L095_PLAMA|nr:peptidase, putative [Plasmodium malariae]SBT79927.1 peptidase, putative [Plasmodium malariae]SCO93564.1 peptidase, putative [Plasmodium malariae]